jgi:hypothetical protein
MGSSLSLSGFLDGLTGRCGHRGLYSLLYSLLGVCRFLRCLPDLSPASFLRKGNLLFTLCADDALS